MLGFTRQQMKLLGGVTLTRFWGVEEEKDAILNRGGRDKKSHCESRQREQVSNAHPQTGHASLVTVGCEARVKA
jgi:hypothetical protein